MALFYVYLRLEEIVVIVTDARFALTPDRDLWISHTAHCFRNFSVGIGKAQGAEIRGVALEQ